MRISTSLAAAAFLTGSTIAAFAGSSSGNDYDSNYSQHRYSQQRNNDYSWDDNSDSQSGQYQRNSNRNYGSNQRGDSSNDNRDRTYANQNRNSVPYQLRSKLREQGYSNIQIAAGSYVVRATDQDGDPVLMLVGPHSMTIISGFDAGSSNRSGRNGDRNSYSGRNSNSNFSQNDNGNSSSDDDSDD